MGSRRMPGGFQGLNVCQRGGELLSRFCEVGTVEAGGNESRHFLPETGSAATSLIIVRRGAFVSLEAED